MELGFVLFVAFIHTIGVLVGMVIFNYIVRKTDLLNRFGTNVSEMEYTKAMRWFLAFNFAIIVIEVIVGIVSIV